MSSAHVSEGDAQSPAAEEAIPQPPKTRLEAAEMKLAELGYHFNDALQMRQVANDEPFEFRTQAHYEELGDSVADYIQELMLVKYGMQRWILPVGRGPKRVRVLEADEEDEGEGVPIFVSENAKEAQAVLVLVCGSGAVMAGQWARKLCMNDSLHQGSVIPLLVWAAQREVATVVLNPNFRLSGGARMNAELHVVQAWDQVIAGLPVKHVAMVAHSYGGVCACRLLSEREEEVLPRLRCIAFTDSVHGTWGPDILSSASKRFFVRHCVNWAQSEAPLNTLMEKAYLPAEDKDPESETEGEMQPAWTPGAKAAMGTGVRTGQKIHTETGTEMETETKTETEREPEAESEPMNVYDQVLEEVSGKKTGKAKQSGGMEGTGSDGERTEGLSEAVIVGPKDSEEREVSAADVGATAAGLGFFEEEAIDVSREKDDVSLEKDIVGGEKEDVISGHDDVSMEEAAGGSGPDVTSDETGQVFEISDKGGLMAAAERETDPAMKETLLKFAGRAADDDVTAGPSGSGADASTARGDVDGIRGARADVSGGRGIAGMMARGGGGGRAGKRDERGGRPVRKAQKTGFSWANLGKNKEYCRCLELSAGVDEHERTTYSALESVKKFLEEKLTDAGAELRSTGEAAVGGGKSEEK
ncbi:hypothetical protein KFL_000440440 [Klebsormidium nitens]|uniref:Arb2 domain-containing protein n=1 Tax=Klebsormidium nitens TaxID=105231 RepID=A0A1Y1HPP9_KLENI|nr:hypothetical protein KFL_000440440 [Klebsormidium nitens]|eukprot:GAQ80043.1 hypothetical protein KFL_000440440 [Klebsormidium nitens]